MQDIVELRNIAQPNKPALDSDRINLDWQQKHISVI